MRATADGEAAARSRPEERSAAEAGASREPRPGARAGAAWMRSDLVPRVLSAIVLAALVGGLLYVGGIPLDVLVGAAALLCAWELVDLLRGLPGAAAPRWLVAASAVWLAERAVLPSGAGSPEVILAVALLAGLAAAVLLRVPWSALLAGLGGGLYIGVGLGALLGLYHWPGAAPGTGSRLLGIVIAAVIATDTLAYFTGRAAGCRRHPFFPSISPQKSVEGAVGGAVGAVLVTGIALPLVLGVSAPWAVGTGLLLAVAAEGGDLAESALKRQAGVKDSGRLIPGHGGLLDRVDGLVVAGLAVYVLLALIGYR
jgi:phosphatidate cytidylyltransferase